MRSEAIGPIPIKSFLNQFLSGKRAPRRRIRKDTFKCINPTPDTREYDDNEDNGISEDFVSVSSAGRQHWARTSI